MDINDILSALGSSGALQKAASAAGVSPDDAQTMLSGVLDHAQSGGAMDAVGDAVAAKTGLDPATVNQFLPMAAQLLQGHADATGDQSGLSGLLGALGGGGEGGGGLLGMAAGLFGSRE